MWLTVSIILFLVSLALFSLLLVQYHRFSKLINKLSDDLDKLHQIDLSKTQKWSEKSAELIAERETLLQSKKEWVKQKYAMAEASISLLELREELTSKTDELTKQKYAMANSNLKLMELTENLREEQERSDRLLRNILPERVINDLSKNGSSQPELFENVTVFFSDIVGFTTISSKLEPQILIAELSDIFTAFDRIFVGNGCERIKTIGDAYLSVSGMPVPCETHCQNILKSALQAMDYLRERNAKSEHQWVMRMGVHSGKVIGGIVGVEKYIYDVFGDTINTASRMESNSEPMKINISESSYNLGQSHFNFEPRPPQEVKGKGVMQMFYLLGEK